MKFVVVWISALLCLAGGIARAHDPFEVTTEAQLRPASIEMLVTMSRSTAMETCGDGKTRGVLFDPEKFESLRPYFMAGAPKLYDLRISGSAVQLQHADVTLGRENDVEFHLVYPRPAAGGTLRIDAVHLRKLPPEGYGAVLTVLSETGKLLGTKLLTIEDSAMEITLPPGGAVAEPAAQPAQNTPSFRAFLKLGIEHILTGYDHLLFLCGLLVVCRRFSSVAVVITCFTIAHSLTLGLAALNVVTIPSRIVEPLIAATIIFVGLENLVRTGEPSRRWMLTFAFGLIHGFGFASALKEVGLGTRGTSLVVPLFSFNLGVEIGQIAVAALVLPVLWKLREVPGFARYSRQAISVAVVLMGSYWLIQRTLF